MGPQQQTVAELKHPENAEDTNGRHHSAIVDIEKGEGTFLRKAILADMFLDSFSPNDKKKRLSGQTYILTFVIVSSSSGVMAT